MASPSVHPAESLNDALSMLDSHIPLTFRERKMILTGLYDTAFRDGAKQGRQAGTEAVHADIRSAVSQLQNDPAVQAPMSRVDVVELLEALLPPVPVQAVEYRDPTDVIREKLAAIAVLNQ